MQVPVIVYENGDICLFASKEAAARALEPIDIKHGEYRIFDANGMLITPRVIKRKYGNNWIEAVELLASHGEQVPETELRSMLADFLVRANLKSKAEISSLDFDSILEVFVKEVGYTD